MFESSQFGDEKQRLEMLKILEEMKNLTSGKKEPARDAFLRNQTLICRGTVQTLNSLQTLAHARHYKDYHDLLSEFLEEIGAEPLFLNYLLENLSNYKEQFGELKQNPKDLRSDPDLEQKKQFQEQIRILEHATAAQTLRIKKLESDLSKIVNERDQLLTKLGEQGEQLDKTVRQLNRELKKHAAPKLHLNKVKPIREKKVQTLSVRITRRAANFLQKFADEHGYTSINALVSDLICHLPYRIK